MTVMKKIATLLLVILAVLASCKKDREEKSFKLNPDAMPYILFRQGQYLIYKDSASGMTDSVVVTDVSLQKEPFTYKDWSNDVMAAEQEVYRFTLTSKRAAGDSVWLSGTAKAGLLNQVIVYNSLNDAVFVYPTTCLCDNIFSTSTLTIESVPYKQVIAIDETAYGYHDDWYWAPSVGLVQRRVQDLSLPFSDRITRTYTLLRHS